LDLSDEPVVVRDLVVSRLLLRQEEVDLERTMHQQRQGEMDVFTGWAWRACV